MVRFFIFLLGMLTISRSGGPRFDSVRDQDSSRTRQLPNPSGPQRYGAPDSPQARGGPRPAPRYGDGGEWWPATDEWPSAPSDRGPYAPGRGSFGLNGALRR